MDKFCFEITEELENERIDKCLSMLIDSLSRSFIQKLIKDEAVSVNGQPVKGSYKVKTDDIVEFALPKSQNLTLHLRTYRWIFCMKMQMSLS